MTKILLAGRLDLGPLARHIRAFIETLSSNKENEIYIDPFYVEHYRCEAFGTQALLDEYLSFENIKIAKEDNEIYDFAIFTDLLTLSYHDGLYRHFLNHNCKIRICYEVFDGSLPPLDWIDIINENFDICCTPSVYIASCLKKYGVKIPCFNLPCVVFNDDLLEKYPVKEKYWRFGFIGGAEQRKNALKVIEAFHEAFKGVNDVELYCHCSYSPEPEYVAQCFMAVEKYGSEQKITFNFQKPLSKEKMYELIQSFSFYVFPTKNTGYFTTPCEALSVGIPIIVSDIPVHQELVQNLTEKDGAFLIKADEVDLMIHSYLGNKCLGAQYDMSVASIIEQMKKAYSYRKSLFEKELIEKRKEIAKQYSLHNLKASFLTLIHPKKIVISSKSGIQSDTLFLTSAQTAEKFLNLYDDIKLRKECSENEYKSFKFYINNQHDTDLIEKISMKVEREIHIPLAGKLSDPTSKQGILNSKWMKKLLRRSEKSGVTRLPRFIYKAFSLYCKTKSIFKKGK